MQKPQTFDFPFLQVLNLRAKASTAGLIVAVPAALLLSIGKPPEVKLLATGAAAAISVGAGALNRTANETDHLLETHTTMADVRRQRNMLDHYAPAKPKAQTIFDMAVQLMKAGKQPEEIIREAWGYDGSLYPEGLEHWRRLGLPGMDSKPPLYE